MNGLTGERLRYLVNGLVATAVHFGVLEVAFGLMGTGTAGIANAMGAIAGITCSFLGSRYFVFQGARDGAMPGQAGKFLLLYGAIAIFHAGFLWLWTDTLGLNHRIGFLFATVFQVIGSYFGNRLWVFR